MSRQPAKFTCELSCCATRPSDSSSWQRGAGWIAMERSLKTLTLAGLLSASASWAHAGGFSRGTADTDILYEPGNFNMRVGATVVVPNQKFKTNVNPALVGTNFYGNYIV